uniref:Kinesin-like protein KIF16B n=1 Tax=Hydra vulgaris TaxID=6087 RepID=T2M7P5_HYDVU
MASVKVAVRVRPINKRERDMNASIIIKMNGKKTSITNPSVENDIKDFSYDYSYWSVDSNSHNFTSQQQVFEDLGMDVIDSAFQGYNACIFAYGQTGAGKSYSMMGCPDAVELTPRICESLYSRMATDQADNKNKVEFKTEVSYLEIYNEHVRDLLRPTTKKDDFNLKVREHPKDGPYVQDLSKHLVTKYSDIEKLMDMGNNTRTTASTNMNDTSSRSHAIFTINFTQAKFYTDMPSETVSKIHLVDLAGSERANSTGASGQRLKEGANINKSLVTLGSVISALAESSNMDISISKKKLFVPYRDSVLTWLLKDSLGGNSKTIMIAAISPADINYSETISTLRYANRAKNIINKPTINEDASVKLIRDLREEIESLRRLLQNVDKSLLTPNSRNEEKLMTEKLHKNEAQVQQLYKDWNNKWKETHKIMEEKALAFRREGFGIKMESEMPHLICIDDDILSTGVTLYHLNEGRTHLGTDDAAVKQDIVLRGPGVEPQHCILESIEGNVTIHPIAEENYVNGKKVTKPLRLTQGAVLLLGKTNMFRFNHPSEAAKLRQKYASVDNLASLVPEIKDLDQPSYLFYNAGLEMERRYHEETKDLEKKRKEIEEKQADDAKKLELARLELDSLHNERKIVEEEQHRKLLESEKRLEDQKKLLDRLKEEQERARENAQRELQELKLRIQQEQVYEKQRMDEEMKRLMLLKEKYLLSTKVQEDNLAKHKEELEKSLIEERQKIEEQRQEVIRLQQEYEKSREFVAEMLENKNIKSTAIERKESFKANELRIQLKILETQYEEATKASHIEISQAKESLQRAEQDTLEGKVGLMQGKSELQRQWKLLEALQTKHKKHQEEIQKKIKDIKIEIEIAEKAEEEELMSHEQTVIEQRQARKKVEEATKKLVEMESKMKRVNSITERREEWRNIEEEDDLTEKRKIFMELLGKHQFALLKASQLVSETKTKLENHLANEAALVVPIRKQIEKYEKELEPLLKQEALIEKECQDLEKEATEKKKVLYKQRKRINLLEKQHAQESGNEGREGLSPEENEDLDQEKDAEMDLILREKSVLRELEEKYRNEQKQIETYMSEKYKSIERQKEAIVTDLEIERKKLSEIVTVHAETREFIEAELNGREEILKLSKEKVIKDKRELAKLDMKYKKRTSIGAEELFVMAEVLEKELADSGKKDELNKIKDHRKKLQELDRQLKLAEQRERSADATGTSDEEKCTLL